MVEEKVNWKLEYKLDCIFNIVVWLLMGLALILEADLLAMFIIVTVGLLLNMMASKFFFSNKYY